MQPKILFPGTFDPITNGHIDLIHRATLLFSEVIVAIAADTYGKTAVLEIDMRQNLVQEALKGMPVRVIQFQGLTVHCALKQGVQAILRGLRGYGDFEYEQRMAAMNKQLAPMIDTCFLATQPQYAHLSATLVRQIAELGGDMSGLVPPHVADALKHFFNKRRS